VLLEPPGEVLRVTLGGGEVIFTFRDAASGTSRTAQVGFAPLDPAHIAWKGSFDGLPARGELISGNDPNSVVVQGTIGEGLPFRMRFKLTAADVNARIGCVEVRDFSPLASKDRVTRFYRVTAFVLGWDGTVRQSAALQTQPPPIPIPTQFACAMHRRAIQSSTLTRVLPVTAKALAAPQWATSPKSTIARGSILLRLPHPLRRDPVAGPKRGCWP